MLRQYLHNLFGEFETYRANLKQAFDLLAREEDRLKAEVNRLYRHTSLANAMHRIEEASPAQAPLEALEA